MSRPYNWDELRKSLEEVNRQESVLTVTLPKRGPERLLTGMTDGLIPPVSQKSDPQPQKR